MSAPILQFKRGNAGVAGTVPALRPGEPGFSLNNFDLFVGLDTSVSGNKFFGSHRYWGREDGTTSLRLKLVDKDGTNGIHIKSPNTVSGIGTYILPDTNTISDGYFLKVSSNGTLSWDTVGGTNGSFSNPTLTGVTTITGSLDVTADASFTGITTISNVVTVGTGVGITQFSTSVSTGTSTSSVPTSSAVIDYVTSQIGSIDQDDDLSIAGDTGTGTIDLDTQTLTIAGTANEIRTSVSGQTVTVGLTTNVTITGDLRINGGDILSGTGATTITLSGNDATFADNITVNGSVKVNDIQSAGGLSAISITTFGDPATTSVNIYEDFAVTGFSYFTQAISVDTNIFALGSVFTNNIGAYDETSAITITDGTGDVGIATNLTVGNNLTVSSDLTVQGNLYVNGSTTQVNTNTLTVEDRTIELGRVQAGQPASTTWDLAVLFNYGDSGAKKAGVVWEASGATKRFQFTTDVDTGSDGGPADTNLPSFTVANFAPIEIAELWVNNSCTGGAQQVIGCVNSQLQLQNIVVDAGTF